MMSPDAQSTRLSASRLASSWHRIPSRSSLPPSRVRET